MIRSVVAAMAGTVCLLLTAGAVSQGAGQVFRTRTAAVALDVAVTRGRRPVQGLTAADFVVKDNGVSQDVELVESLGVPIDLTAVIDVSGSAGGDADDARRIVLEAADLLGPDDRIRVLAFGSSVRLVKELGPPAGAFDEADLSLGGQTAVSDAVLLAMIRRPVPGRRHLVVLFTDGQDNMSISVGGDVLAVARRTDVLLHVVWSGSRIRTGPGGGLRAVPGAVVDMNEVLSQAAVATGGQTHGTGLFSGSVTSAIARLVEEFKQGYVLTYSPAGVATSGWHELSVDVPGVRGAAVRARRGYFAGSE